MSKTKKNKTGKNKLPRRSSRLLSKRKKKQLAKTMKTTTKHKCPYSPNKGFPRKKYTNEFEIGMDAFLSVRKDKQREQKKKNKTLFEKIMNTVKKTIGF